MVFAHAFIGLFLILLLLAAYFLPTLIALGRHRPNALAIWLVNLFLGWTMLGWVGALVWAVTTPATPARGAV